MNVRDLESNHLALNRIVIRRVVVSVCFVHSCLPISFSPARKAKRIFSRKWEWLTRDGEFKFPVTHMQQVQMDEMAKVLLAGKDFPEHISGWEGYKDAKVIDAIYQSAQTGTRVLIK